MEESLMNEERECYCGDITEEMRQKESIPVGYCGICEVCNQPGHTVAHPSRPITSAWCDEHYQELLDGKIISGSTVLFYALLLIGFAYGLYRWVL